MGKIEVPFLPEFEKPMLEGRKTCTSRNKRYGDAGDTFDKFGATFKLTEVTRYTLQGVAHNFYCEEGFNCAGEFISIWNRLHPRKQYVPTQLVWVHFFRRVIA